MLPSHLRRAAAAGAARIPAATSPAAASPAAPSPAAASPALRLPEACFLAAASDCSEGLELDVHIAGDGAVLQKALHLGVKVWRWAREGEVGEGWRGGRGMEEGSRYGRWGEGWEGDERRRGGADSPPQTRGYERVARPSAQVGSCARDRKHRAGGAPRGTHLATWQRARTAEAAAEAACAAASTLCSIRGQTRGISHRGSNNRGISDRGISVRGSSAGSGNVGSGNVRSSSASKLAESKSSDVTSSTAVCALDRRVRARRAAHRSRWSEGEAVRRHQGESRRGRR